MEKYINSIEIPFGKIIIHSPNKDYLCSNVLKSSFYSNKISKKVFEVFLDLMILKMIIHIDLNNLKIKDYIWDIL